MVIDHFKVVFGPKRRANRHPEHRGEIQRQSVMVEVDTLQMLERIVTDLGYSVQYVSEQLFEPLGS